MGSGLRNGKQQINTALTKEECVYVCKHACVCRELGMSGRENRQISGTADERSGTIG